MCMDHTVRCSCGRHAASLTFKDEILPAEVVDRLFCPSCAAGIVFNRDTMLADNGWVIQYDMDVARFMSGKLPSREVTPDFLFDQGYCTWRGVYPTDHMDSLREREELVRLSKINPLHYLNEIRRWGNERMKRLAAEGWRKAHADM